MPRVVGKSAFSGLYILHGKLPIPEPDATKWARWFEKSIEKRRVGSTKIGALWVSTIFLGIDHDHFGTGQPLLFETIVFNGDETLEQQRYESWQEAHIGHKEIVARIRADIKKKVNT